MPDKKDLGRELHEHISAAAHAFIKDHGGVIDAEVIIGAFLSGAIRAIVFCPCEDLRATLVEQCINQIIKHSNAPIAVLVTDCPLEGPDDALAMMKPAGRA